MNNMKLCKDCEKIQDLSEFYKAGKSYQSRCKPCHNNKRKDWKNISKYVPRIKKITGFRALDDELQKEILWKMSGRVSMKKICTQHDLNYSTFKRWKKDGHLCADEEKKD